MHNQPQSMLMISSVLSLSRIYDPDNSSGVRACPGQAIRRTTLSSGAQPFIVLLSRNGDADQKKSTCSKPLVPQAWRINPLACSRNSPQAVRSENTWPGREEGRERMSTTVWSLSPWLRWHTHRAPPGRRWNSSAQVNTTRWLEPTRTSSSVHFLRLRMQVSIAAETSKYWMNEDENKAKKTESTKVGKLAD